MRLESILIGFIASAVFLYVFWYKTKKLRRQADRITTRPSEEHLPKSRKENDKLVIANNISFTDLQKIITEILQYVQQRKLSGSTQSN